MPIFGSFPGPLAGPDPPFHASGDDVSSHGSGPPKTSPSLRARDSLQIIPSNQSLRISSKTNLSLPASLSEHCQPEPEHGPLSMACAQATATSRHWQACFQSTHPAQDKPQPNNGHDNVQDITGCDQQSSARRPFETKTSNKHSVQNSIVPALSASLPNISNRTQRDTWLDHTNHTVDSGQLQWLAPQDIAFSFPSPYEALPPRAGSSLPTPTPQSSRSRLQSPRRRNRTMCQTYSKTNPSWCLQPCSPSIPSPLLSHFDFKTTPSTTPLSSWSGLTTPPSSIKTQSSTQSKYKTGSPAHIKTCAPERARDEMSYHPRSQEYHDAVTTSGLYLTDEIYDAPAPMRATQQHEMRSLPHPQRTREEIYRPPQAYSPNPRDFESVSEFVEGGLAPDPDLGVDLVNYGDRIAMPGDIVLPSNPTSQNHSLALPAGNNPLSSQSLDIDQSYKAWDDILADFPTSVEHCPPNNDPTSRDIYLPSEILNAVMASAGGTISSKTGTLEQEASLANQTLCTLANRCRLCAGFSSFARLDVHPELNKRNRLTNPTARQVGTRAQNGLLEQLASESEPFGWEYTGRRGGPNIWGAIGEPVPRLPRRHDGQNENLSTKAV